MGLNVNQSDLRILKDHTFRGPINGLDSVQTDASEPMTGRGVQKETWKGRYRESTSRDLLRGQDI